MRILYLFFLFILINLGYNANAQTPQYFKGGGTGSNSYPFSSTVGLKTQHLYLPGDLPGAVSGNITRIYFRSVTPNVSATFTNFSFKLGQTTATQFPGAGLTFATPLTTVISGSPYTVFSAIGSTDWFYVDLPTPFPFDANQSLILEVVWDTKTAGGFNVRTSSGPGAPNNKRLTSGSPTATTGSASTNWMDFGIDVSGASPCNVPTGLAATGVTYTSATLNWNAVTGATGYEYALNTSATPPASGTQQAGTSYPATGLSAATTYYFHVRTQCATSTFSGWTTISFTTLTCGAPTGLAANNITTTSADVSWIAVSGATGYEYALTTSSTPPASGTNTTVTTYSASGLTAATNYCLHVRTVCAPGVYSTWSTYCFNTSASPVCNPPSAPVISNITATTADVNWGAVTGASGYEYEVSTNATPPAAGTAIPGTSYSAGPLTGNTIYYAHVRTDCGVNGFSSWVTTSFNTADTCLAPTATVTNITDTTADINWTAMGGAISYEYEVGTNATPPANGTNIITTSYNAINLAKNTQHYVHLRTICTNDTSDWSTANFMTTNVTSVHLTGKIGASMAVYPNPTNGVMTVKITGVTQVNAMLTLSDVTGKIVKIVPLTQNKTEIDLSAFTSGVYLLKYTDDTGSSTIRVIKE